VTTIVSREKGVRRAAGIGVLWGLGHTVTIFVVGGAILLFDLVIPPRVGLTMEFSVAVMLVLLGTFSLTGATQGIRELLARDSRETHSHSHAHGDYVHRHEHGHVPDRHGHSEDATPLARLDGWFGRLSLYQVLRPLVIGVVHGLAGSAAVALLVLATIRDATWGLVYLAVFGIGTIAGMMLITAAVSLPFAYTSRHLSGFNRSLGIASGLLSLGFGLFLVYQIGFVNGLFTGHPHWTPR
jgi:ABC-type nickel/cobalt efflux system permease component RcnA